MTTPLTLDEDAHRVWLALRELGEADVEALSAQTGLDQSKIVTAAHNAEAAGHFAVTEEAREEVVPAGDAEALLDALPERRALELLQGAGGSMEMPAFVAATKEAGIAMNEVFRWGGARGWVERQKSPAMVVLTEAGAAAIGNADVDEVAVRRALDGRTYVDELEGIDADRLRKLLKGRKDLGQLKGRKKRVLSLTPAGLAALDAGVEVKKERTQLTHEDLASGAWKDIALRPYDVTLPAAPIQPAKMHPLRRVMEEIRRVYLEMGFEEIWSPMVESAFWNFDSLFQPQDHPARDMQDTFYMSEPGQIALPDDDLVQRVSSTHETGGDTGSEGWGYKWSPDLARQVVLRTHTTAATIRSLHENPNPPRKVFIVGWTYRNETISFKHLPVFHQVDGVVIDEKGSLASLMGTLKEFYRKMGFDKVNFKPAFYPYTEPSVDVMVYMESRGKWIEMGGSGIFRPEVTEPLGCKHPVLAWGLGVERLAMIRLGFSDIRELYDGSLDLIEGVPLCR